MHEKRGTNKSPQADELNDRRTGWLESSPMYSETAPTIEALLMRRRILNLILSFILEASTASLKRSLKQGRIWTS